MRRPVQRKDAASEEVPQAVGQPRPSGVGQGAEEPHVALSHPHQQPHQQLSG